MNYRSRIAQVKQYLEKRIGRHEEPWAGTRDIYRNVPLLKFVDIARRKEFFDLMMMDEDFEWMEAKGKRGPTAIKFKLNTK